jgi:hypothetical protein
MFSKNKTPKNESNFYSLLNSPADLFAFLQLTLDPFARVR